MHERIVAALEQVRERLYRDQPDTMGAVDDLITTLQCVFCNHEWETKQSPDTPDGPGERYSVCKKCGFED